jgi:hypothetical protein
MPEMRMTKNKSYLKDDSSEAIYILILTLQNLSTIIFAIVT